MYWRILKKDLKRKRTMNIILFLFIMLAAMFIASGTSNMVTISTALDKFFEKAGVPDHLIVFKDKDNKEKYKDFADANNYNYKFNEMIYGQSDDIKIDGEKSNYSNILCIETLENPLKLFDSNDNEIKEVADGEIYVTASLFNSNVNNFKRNGHIQITVNNQVKTFTIKDYTKDAICSSSMLGMAKFLVSSNDYNYLKAGKPELLYGCCVYTDDKDYNKKAADASFNSMIKADYNAIKQVYILELVKAAVILTMSICIILISMVILRFTINFTMSEEFREIGVMKAIGIKNSIIRILYIIKYLAISVTGSAAGFIVSIPFGNFLLESVSQNIIISNNGNYFINILCVIFTISIVVLFCYMCTRKIKGFSPIDAIRNGETGERYHRKGFIHLSKSKLPPVVFMALNDILSSPSRYISMVVVFILGILLVIVPVNTINTLQSDKLVKWFSMSECDHIISQDIILANNSDNFKLLEGKLDNVKDSLEKNNIDAIVFQELVFRADIMFEGQRSEVMMQQGIGGVTTDMYSYIEGTPPERCGEIAITNVVAERIGAKVGDDVEVKAGGNTKTYIVTAINQSMQNMGDDIRIYQDEETSMLDIIGVMGIQVKYRDNPDSSVLSERKKLLKKLYPDAKIYSSGGYISHMIGDVGGQISGIKNLILAVVICINILITVLMVRSFITKEKSEIAILKAVGFKDILLSFWQALRIMLVLLVSVILGILLQLPASQLFISPIFKMMGAYNIEFYINKFEVYLLYPVVIIITTFLAAFLSSQSLRKIHASQASNIE